jgi:hypothetical protein
MIMDPMDMDTIIAMTGQDKLEGIRVAGMQYHRLSGKVQDSLSMYEKGEKP